jgi:hypothetical protein
MESVQNKNERRQNWIEFLMKQRDRLYSVNQKDDDTEEDRGICM